MSSFFFCITSASVVVVVVVVVFYVRQIDDIFCIWLDDKENPNAWKEFQKYLNSACKLEWTTTPLS